MQSLREKLLLAAGPGQFAGVTAGDWLSILRDNGFRVDPRYLPRVALISLNSLNNSLIRRYEELAYGTKVRSVRVLPPIFILGHWRSGTTHLHNLFTIDPRLAYPNLFQVVFPLTFLSTEPIAGRFLSPLIPEKRLGDNVRQHLAMAAEDEFALCAATSLSPYMSSSFPRRQEFYDRYLTLRDVPDEEVGAVEVCPAPLSAKTHVEASTADRLKVADPHLSDTASSGAVPQCAIYPYSP